jgi:malonate transporter MadL subunit
VDGGFIRRQHAHVLGVFITVSDEFHKQCPLAVGFDGLGSDVGGVGFAMVIFILIQVYLQKSGKSLDKKTEGGIQFVSAMYIPVVVAMSMNQDVYSALASGLVPLVAGLLAVVIPLALIPVLRKLAKD